MASKRKYYPTTPARKLAAPVVEVKNGRKPPIKDTRGSDKIEVDFFHLYESLYRKEVLDWQQARISRRDPFNPVTYLIQQLYKDAMLDNHLQGAIENRILRIINKEVVLKNPQGDIDDERSRYVQKRWMRHVIRRAMESKFYGYSLLFINDAGGGSINSIIDIPRENVIPEKGILLKDAVNITGPHIRFREFPTWLLYIQLGSDAVGVLERVAPMTIYKRHSWASWDEFEQIFGVPIRIARTMINTKKHKDEIQNWLEVMGTASYGIFDKQTDIEIKENAKTDSFNVFMQKIQVINKEISKGIVGQTMTMDDGSSQSQANVHLEIYQAITDADIMDVQDWLSDDFLPVMRKLGFDIPEGYYVELLEKSVIKPEDRIKVDGELLKAGINLTDDYLERTYDVEINKDQPRTGQIQPLKGINGKTLVIDEDFFA